jgi:prepilin-type N-terminal cleavage/methylation domain-containing protein
MKKAFTLIELMVVIGAMGLLFSLTIPALTGFRGSTDLQNSAEGALQALKRAEVETLASKGDSQWGVYFDTSVTPHRYTLFRGPSYALRTVNSDLVFEVPRRVEIFQMDLAGGGQEVVVGRVVGTTTQSGSIGFRIINNPTRAAVLSIDSSGRVSSGTEAPGTPPLPLLVDSRHVHTVYSRAIAAASETITLSFDGGAVQTIVPIASNLVGSEIDWTGTTSVGGEPQTIRIRTHRLNASDTLLSIHRDRRYNTKSLTLKLSGDASGTFLEYSADGLTTLKTSIYAGTPEWR